MTRPSTDAPRNERRRKKRRPSAAGRGALGLLAALFLASGGLRLAEGTGADIRDGLRAFAAEESEPAEPPPDRPSSEAVLSALAAREADIDRREQAIAERERAVALAEARISEKLAALEATEGRLRETIALADGAAAADLERLTRLYERMDPDEAAALFETMDPNFAAGFLGQMRPDAAAAILAGLAPQTAYTVSLVLAGRNMRVPTE